MTREEYRARWYGDAAGGSGAAGDSQVRRLLLRLLRARTSGVSACCEHGEHKDRLLPVRCELRDSLLPVAR